MTKKILIFIFSLVFIGAFVGVLAWGIINFNNVKSAMSGTGLYTQEDLNKAYQDGYNTALDNKDEYDGLINGYRDTITTLNDNISQLNSQITSLTNSNRDYVSQIDNITSQKAELQRQVEDLAEGQKESQDAIGLLNDEISGLNSQIDSLNTTILFNQNNITLLQEQIGGLNIQIESLNTTITSNEAVITELRKNINDLNNQIVELANSNSGKDSEIVILNGQIDVLNEQIQSLENMNEDCIASINVLNNQIEVLTVEKNNLINENVAYLNTISSLNNQLFNLQTINSQLEQINILQSNTITSLNNQITNLTNQINDITLQSQDNSSLINSLNAKINELQASILYYESYIANLETGEQVVATFEYDGSVLSIQIVNKGSKTNISVPENTTYKIFNGWKVDGSFVNLNNYEIYNNTKFVADITYKYDVIFKVDGVEHNTQIVTLNNKATIPSAPTKSGYEFNGWSIDGVNVIDVSTNAITSNTIYYAVFTKLHTVNFIYEGETLSSQTIRNGKFAQAVQVENTKYKVFNGWKLNNAIVDLSSYKITGDTTFTADITYKYDVLFVVDGNIYNSQIVAENNFSILPEIPQKDGYEFNCWTLGGAEINVSTYSIRGDTTFVAKFSRLHLVQFICEDTIVSTQEVVNNGKAINVEIENSQYKIFNGWTVDGVIVDISKYKISKDTTFVANITYKYDVTFIVDDNLFNTQLVTEYNVPILPNNPTKEGYAFEGWTTDGTTVVDVLNINITGNTVYMAKFIKTHVVYFMYEENIISIQNVKEGSYAIDPNIESTSHKVFNGWKVGIDFVDISTLAITEPTTIYADITYYFDVAFMVGEEEYENLHVTSDEFRLPNNPTKVNFKFEGWSIDGENIFDFEGFELSEDISFTAIFTYDWDGTYTCTISGYSLSILVKNGVVYSCTYRGTTTQLTEIDSQYYPAGTYFGTKNGIKATNGNYTYLHLRITMKFYDYSQTGVLDISYKWNTSANYDYQGAASSSAVYGITKKS